MSTDETLFHPDDPRLTAYALGELTDPAECAQVEEFLAASPEARAELADIRALAAALTAEYEQERATAEAAPANVVPMPRSRWRSPAPWLKLAALFLIFGLAAGSLLPIYHLEQARSRNAVASDARITAPEVAHAKVAQAVTALPAAPASAESQIDPLLAAKDNSASESAALLRSPVAASTPAEAHDFVISGGNTYTGSTVVTSGALVATAASPSVTARYAAAPQPTSRGRLIAQVSRQARLDDSNGVSLASSAEPDQLKAPSSWRASVTANEAGDFDKFSDRPETPGAVSEKSMRDEKASSFNTADYAHTVENPFLAARENPLSTFSIDVDTASYSIVRRFIDAGSLPPKDAVRVEEMLNYFPYEDAPPAPGSGQPFAIHLEAAACPWDTGHRLVRIGIKAREIDRDQRPPSNLVFLLDVSGSMMPDERLPLIKQCLHAMVEKLREDDHVAIVVYAGESGLALPSTSGDQKDVILRAIDKLQAGGSTNGAAGIRLAYQVARQHFIKGGTNRVILSTDGDFNVGVTSRGGLLRLIEEERRDGVFLTVLGVGTDNLKDSTMQVLADHGNGNYAYIDRLEEGRKILVNQMSGTLVTVAKDVKIQVEFNPAAVASYRLIGYEKRLLRKEDFNDDRVDAGEIGAGHSVTALYEIVPVGQPSPGVGPAVDALKYQPAPAVVDARRAPEAAAREMLTVKMRQKAPGSEGSERTEEVAFEDHGQPGEYANASPDFQFAAAVASFGMVLRQSPHKGSATLGSALELAQAGKGGDPDGYRAGFIELLRQAQALPQGGR